MRFLILFLLVVFSVFGAETPTDNPRENAKQAIESIRQIIRAVEKAYGLDNISLKETCESLRKKLYKAASPDYVQGDYIIVPGENGVDYLFKIHEDCSVTIVKANLQGEIYPETREAMEETERRSLPKETEVSKYSPSTSLKMIAFGIYAFVLTYLLVSSAVFAYRREILNSVISFLLFTFFGILGWVIYTGFSR